MTWKPLVALILLAALAQPVNSTSTETVLLDSLDLSHALDIPGQMSGKILTDNHPSDSSSTSSLGQTFRFSQDTDRISSITLSMARSGVGGNPTVDLVAVISSSDGSVPVTELFRSNTKPANSLERQDLIKLYPVTFAFSDSASQTGLQKNTWYSFEIQTSATGIVNIGDGVSIFEAAEGSETAPGNSFWYSSVGYQTLDEDFVYEVRGVKDIPSSGGGASGDNIDSMVSDLLGPAGPLGGSAMIIAIAGIAAIYLFGRGRKR